VADKLRETLDPGIVAILLDPAAWYALDPILLRWLANTAAGFPWLNHLAFIGIVQALHGYANPSRCITDVGTFLRWAIPAHYPDIATLDPEQALFAYFGDPPRPHAWRVLSSYSANQFNIKRYLATLPPERRAALLPFTMPELVLSGRLNALKQLMTNRQKERRKKQAFPVGKRLAHLAAAARRRTKWLFDLDALVQDAIGLVRAGEASLPVTVTLQGLDARQDVVFRVWNRKAWFIAHRQAYGYAAWSDYQTGPYSLEDQSFFLQLVGDVPENSWVLKALSLGILQGPDRLTPEAVCYIKEWNLPNMHRAENAGVLVDHRSMSQHLRRARTTARGTAEDSRTLFSLEPLLCCSDWATCQMSIVFTGMRIGELQQVTVDRECMETIQLREFDDQSSTWTKTRPCIFWRLFPKGRTRRELYYAHEYMVDAMLAFIRLYKRHQRVDAIQSSRVRTTRSSLMRADSSVNTHSYCNGQGAICRATPSHSAWPFLPRTGLP
jgi:hypothetical protein